MPLPQPAYDVSHAISSRRWGHGHASRETQSRTRTLQAPNPGRLLVFSWLNSCAEGHLLSVSFIWSLSLCLGPNVYSVAFKTEVCSRVEGCSRLPSQVMEYHLVSSVLSSSVIVCYPRALLLTSRPKYFCQWPACAIDPWLAHNTATRRP